MTIHLIFKILLLLGEYRNVLTENRLFLDASGNDTHGLHSYVYFYNYSTNITKSNNCIHRTFPLASEAKIPPKQSVEKITKAVFTLLRKDT